jgi:hypothetical protein
LIGNHDTNEQMIDPNQQLKVLDFFIHESYSGTNTDNTNDICLVEVETISLSPQRNIICLPNQEIVPK